ncbi:MAG: hypothetical protein WBF05_03250, partial [Anaerolineales bacterium]
MASRLCERTPTFILTRASYLEEGRFSTQPPSRAHLTVRSDPHRAPDGCDPRRVRPGGIIWEPGERKEKPMWTTVHFKEALASSGG